MDKFKYCIVCGRKIIWRKKWQSCWANVKYCSNACRKMRLTEIDDKIELTIISKLNNRGMNKSVCPSEIAKELFSDDWRLQMERVRSAARRLVNQNKIVITQKNKIVEPSTAKGPIRLKLK